LRKTTLLRVGAEAYGAVAGSTVICGRGGRRGTRWKRLARRTAICSSASTNSLLCLDEFAEVNAREAGGMVYMLSNGSGKGPGRRDGSARPVAQWFVLFLSSGEIALAAWEANPDRVTTRAGYRRQTSRGWEYSVLPEQWQGELARGFDASALAFAMIERGLMKGEV
jgi:uncharacterized protein (DUF927 family)